MADNSPGSVESQLRKLVRQKKFKPKVWLDRGLNPSDKALCDTLENELNFLLNSLLKVQGSAEQNEYTNVLKFSLLQFDKYELDSEEKELVADYFDFICQIINVDFDKELDIWLYGIYHKDQTTTKPLPVLRTVSSPCQKCGNILSADIVKERQNVQSFWLIVQCNGCNEFNVLDIPENTDRYKKGDYFIFESIKKADATLDEVIAKMNFYKASNND